jgi:CBS domain-containing protein
MGSMTRVSELIRAKGAHVHTIDRAATIADAATAFLENEIGSLLVVEEGRVVGIFTKNDFVRAMMAGASSNRPVSEAMATDLFSVVPGTDLETVFVGMIRKGVRHVPVLEDGRPVGIITPIDILTFQKFIANFENSELMRYIQGTY